jgi:uncharacterized protein YoxC
MTTIITYAIAAITVAVIGIFIYRNNEKLLSKGADKIDEAWDEIEDKINEKKADK